MERMASGPEAVALLAKQCWWGDDMKELHALLLGGVCLVAIWIVPIVWIATH